ncbi:MAG TPA: MBL fold metallo-hydrolase [Rhizomicrobium sp.]|nr:MBL fold metallo-hydrolase [Rhizomicrobium sp.]
MLRKILAAALLSTALSVPAIAAEGALKVVAIDVEGGGGTLFVTPEGTSLLVDTGWPSNYGLLPSPDGAKNSADRIAAVARKLGLTKIDYLIITHYHMDHVGGVVDLAKRIPIGTFIDHGPNAEHLPPGVKDDPQLPGGAPDILYPKYLEVIKGHKHIVAKPGMVIPMGSMTDTIVSSDGVTLSKPLPGAGQPIAACDTALSKSTKADGGEENTRSVASLLTFGKVRIAAFGDLSWKKERELSCPVGKLGHVNLLIVTQHGSNISSNPASIADMRPDVAVMGSGGKKGGDEEAIKTVKSSPGLMGFWQLHENFTHPEWDGDKNMIANLNPPANSVAAQSKSLFSAPPDMGYDIEADVTADGRITVINQRNGFSKTYQTGR